MLASTQKFLAFHRRRSADQQRLGQRFINMYINTHKQRDPMSKLYNEVNDNVAMLEIDQWLQRNNYFDELPPTLRDIYKEQK